MNFFSIADSEGEALRVWQLLNENPESAICKTFGCGRTLTNQEKLFGNKCIRHSIKGSLICDGPGLCESCQMHIINARKYLYG